MKAKSCLRSSKIQVNPEQLAAVNKTTYSRNKIDLEKVNQANKGHDRKKALFSESEDNFIRKGISKYVYGRWTSILNYPGFKFYIYVSCVR